MALNRWEPAPVNRLFTSLFDTQTVAAAPARRFAAPTDIAESETHYLVRMDLPGVSEDDISVELDRTVLTISGERRSQHESRQDGYFRYERSSGSFHRSIRVPEGVDADAIEANFDRGVLEISVPKPERVLPRKVAITVGGTAPALDAADAPAEPAEAPAPETGEPAAA